MVKFSWYVWMDTKKKEENLWKLTTDPSVTTVSKSQNTRLFHFQYHWFYHPWEGEGEKLNGLKLKQILLATKVENKMHKKKIHHSDLHYLSSFRRYPFETRARLERSQPLDSMSFRMSSTVTL